MLRRLAVFPARFVPVNLIRALLCLMLLLAACNPATETLSPTVVMDSPQPPAQIAMPSLTYTEVLPTATTTTILTEIPPIPTVPPTFSPIPLPSQAINHSTAMYVCPWAGLAQSTPVFTYEVVNTYPHDPAAYTQGLIYRDGVLYEGTGLKGQSSLRKVDLGTGEVQQILELPEQYFGEGITELDGKIYQLTWQEQTGFVYDATSFEQVDTFAYPTQGWGLTHDGNNLIMSDGSPNLYFLDPQTLDRMTTWAVWDAEKPVFMLNELEYVEGEVWANIYQTSCIARIDPSNGKVIGWIDITGILAPEDQPGSEVPNGIAYDPAGKRIFVTGKRWPKLFEIQVKAVD